MAQEGVPCARHTQRCMPMNENAGWLWTQGSGKGREASLASGAPRLLGRMAWGCGGAAPVETALEKAVEIKSGRRPRLARQRHEGCSLSPRAVFPLFNTH